MSTEAVPASAEPQRHMRELLLVGVLAASLTVVGVLRHANYWSEFDLAVFDQGVWQLSRGRTYVSLIDRNIFADHFSPVLFLFAPLYRIVATPVWLIVAQSLALAATLIPMRRLADELRAPRWLATVLVIGSGPLLAAGVFDFHASTLAVPFVAVALLGGVARACCVVFGPRPVRRPGLGRLAQCGLHHRCSLGEEPYGDDLAGPHF